MASVALAALALLVVQIGVPTDYYLNDDFTIASILNGSLTGEPEAHTIFNVVPFTVPLAWLYRHAPGVPWFYVALEAATALALAFFCYISLLVAYARHRDDPAPLPIRAALACLLLVALVALGWFPLVHADFTLASALLVGAGCSLAALSAVLPPIGLNARQRVVHLVLAGVLVGVAYCIREKAGLAGLVFLALVLCAGALKNRRGDGEPSLARRIAASSAPLCVAGVLILASMGLQGIAYGSDEWKDFLEFGDFRSAYNDYGHLGYEGNESLFAEYGWDENLYNLSLSWFLMDDRMTTEAFDAFTQHMSISKSVDVPAAFLSDSSAFVRYSLVALICLNMVLLCVTVIHRGIRSRDSLLCIVAFVVMVGLSGYLAYSGRFVYRAAVCALFPSVMISWLCAWCAMCEQGSISAESRGGERRGKAVVVALPVLAAMAVVALLVFSGAFGGKYNAPLLLEGLLALVPVVLSAAPKLRQQRMPLCTMGVALALLLVFGASYVDSVKVRHANAVNDAAAQTMYEYASDHSDDVFIYVAGICSTQPDAKQPTNTRCWGGWTCKAPFNKHGDEVLGFPSGLTAYSLMEDNVYFVTRSGEPKLLREYLTIGNGYDVDFRCVSQLDNGLEVYSFERSYKASE